jgi:ADP-ribose pyrophosphatase
VSRRAKPGEAIDRAVAVEVSPPQLLARGYRDYERFTVTVAGGDHAHQRDVLRGAGVVAILPVDLQRNEVVLIRQFRLSAHLGNGLGEMIEIPAGRLDGEESYAAAAARECEEEIGVKPARLTEVLNYFPTPGLTDERIVVFLAAVDASKVSERGGLASEAEDIRPFTLALDDVAAAVAAGGIHNGATLIALQWLLLNRARIAALLK